jgi:hypothetical protein
MWAPALTAVALKATGEAAEEFRQLLGDDGKKLVCREGVATADADAEAKRLSLARAPAELIMSMSKHNDWLVGSDLFFDCSRTFKKLR